MDKHPKIYRQPIKSLKSKVQNEYYYHYEDKKGQELSKEQLIDKIERRFSSPNFVYRIDINIMLKNGENIRKKVIALQNDYLITEDNERILLDDVLDIK